MTNVTQKEKVISACIAVAGWNYRKGKLNMAGKNDTCAVCDKIIDELLETLHWRMLEYQKNGKKRRFLTKLFRRRRV